MDRWMTDVQLDGWMDRWIACWLTDWMDGWMNGRTDGWMDVWLAGWMDRRTDGQMGGWTDVWMDECNKGFLRVSSITARRTPVPLSMDDKYQASFYTLLVISSKQAGFWVFSSKTSRSTSTCHTLPFYGIDPRSIDVQYVNWQSLTYRLC